MKSTNLRVGDYSLFADYVIACDSICLIAGFFDSTRTKTKAVGCHFGSSAVFDATRWEHPYSEEKGVSRPVWNGNYRFYAKEHSYKVVYKPIMLGRSRFFYGLAVNNDLGKDYMITTKESLYEDFYNLCMNNYKLPLLKEWMEPIFDTAVKRRMVNTSSKSTCFSNDMDKRIVLHGKEVSLSEILVYSNSLTNETLTEIVRELLSSGVICISKNKQERLEFKNFDDYITKYGSAIVKKLDEYIVPLVPLTGECEGVALKHKRLYPQQAACVNGIEALIRSGENYGFLNEGMGVGKTIQAASIIEQYFNRKYMRTHKGATLKDVFESGEVAYRNVIMAPGHLVDKWAEEIHKEIPYAKAIVIRDLSQLIELREHGKKRDAKEFYIISKDFAKLGTTSSPIPTKVKYMYPRLNICKDCRDTLGQHIFQVGIGADAHCPSCNGKNFVSQPIISYGKEYGMVCPHCDNLLIRYSKKVERGILSCGDDDEKNVPPVLKAPDFAKHNKQNAICYNCGGQLWGTDSRPVDCGGHFAKLARREPKWYKISHFKNFREKDTQTAFVLKKHEYEYISNSMASQGYKVCAREYGPRKVAPAAYIKKYLKGYFDFCILDECHKYESGESAQTNAAYSLVKASKFSLGLTGTISNGTAASFFFLLFMLDSARMVKKGYTCSSGDLMRFCEKYGCVETVYEYNGKADLEYKESSRGRVIKQPRVKPGISPLLYAEFLMDHAVMLDITDLSKYLPKLYEKIEICPMPNEVSMEYHKCIDVLKDISRDGYGQKLMSTILQFGLSYQDKPYGRSEIKSPIVKGEVLYQPKNFDEYEKGKLLPKEERLIEIVNSEIAEGRNCFVYAAYTGEPETNVTERLKMLIEKHCNLKNRVQILQASSPQAAKRELWIKKKANDGIKVFITNPKCVETGLDFCFEYGMKKFNYPTIVFYQVTYELATLWQASRRHYRLNQTEECRTYWLACEGTLQTAALEIMAEKQVATAAIQGKFSAEGLSSMAKGVDPRVKLAQALSSNDMSSSDKLLDMFDALNKTNNESEDDGVEYVPPKTFYEVMGISEQDTMQDGISVDEQLSFFTMAQTVVTSTVDEETPKVAVKTKNTSTVKKTKSTRTDSMSLMDMFADVFSEENTIVFNEEMVCITHKKKAARPMDGQCSFMDLLAM